MTNSDPKKLPDLAQLRRDIDAVDDAILDLLLRRFDLGAAVAEAKRNLPPAPNMRPAREAEIIRRLAARWRGPAPIETMVAIWRQIISTVLRLQGPFSVHLAQDNPTSAHLLASNHFAYGNVFQMHQTFERALEHAAADTQSIAILGLPDGQPPSPWWSQLDTDRSTTGKLKIVARLPFLETQTAIAYVIAVQDPVASGDDMSLATVSGGGRSWPQIDTFLKDHQLAGRLVATDGDQYLVEIDGFWTQSMPTVATAINDGRPLGIILTLIGAFARPMKPSAIAASHL